MITVYFYETNENELVKERMWDGHSDRLFHTHFRPYVECRKCVSLMNTEQNVNCSCSSFLPYKVMIAYIDSLDDTVSRRPTCA